MKSVLCLIAILVVESLQQQNVKRNVVVIMADDLGFNDVSFRGSDEIPTPNIDALAFNGAILNRHYTAPLCTPSRSSFMTGKYPHRIGMQHYVIVSDEPWALGKEEKTLPEYFKDAGYSTSMIGKWHLGFHEKQFIPTERGFDTFFGYLGPYIDYWSYTLQMFNRNYSRGYDMRRNDKTDKSFEPLYATDLFTNEAVKVIKDHDKKKPLFLVVNHLAPHAGNEDDPMQAPEDEIQKFEYIENKKRRVLAAMVSRLDISVGKIVETLRDSKMLENTVVVFYSDNGGPTIGIHSTNASNYPLRGQKDSGWEGAIRTNAIVYAPFLVNQGVIRDQLFHVSDWLPTLTRLAGIQISSRMKLDGVDQWDMINYGRNNVRNEVMNVDNVSGFGSLIYHTMKYVNGSAEDNDEKYDGWLSSTNKNGYVEPTVYAKNVLNSPASQAIMSIQARNLNTEKILQLRKAATITCSNSVTKNPCNIRQRPCLFNIIEDPCEENNLAESFPFFKFIMEQKYLIRTRQAVPSRRTKSDPACDPINFDLNWNWWQKDSIAF